MSRVQLAINVENLDEAIDFCSRLFDAVPAKVKPSYANFAIAEPPLKLVLFENQGKGGSINHLGVEVQTTEEVLTAEDRLTRADMVTTGIDETQCCYAEKTEVWVDGPDGVRWEWYVKHADSDQFENVVIDPSQSKRKCCT
ncbi:MAG: glyoxalase/bleomycin resistance/dioxygenase family protein [Acidiferrobacteraceae bacterium]|jgi:hypothetical protein|nr:glyoxalase/bleomycin resistance/dioxygenase family protein [Acidiferrobacteraceae bacterium]MDP7517062.1 ArsI/CadI family heavy metal resistance metalloenzyme [Arenicellales bacterium]|tara:strand:- start:826 stop:1248 length:423 start_codon:yes stop_codon:yes gene_type:complete